MSIPHLIKIPARQDAPDFFPPNMDYPYFDRMKWTGIFPEKKDFSFENCCFLAECAFIAFCHPSFIKFAMRYAGFDGFQQFIGKNVARCFAASNDDMVVVMFRGTEFTLPLSVQGAFADLRFLMTKEGSAFVHSGFKEVLDEIWEGKGMLHRYLSAEKNKNPSKKIFFCGHSLGGALSLIAAFRFSDIDCVYTFGSPRAGNESFADSIKARVFRVVNNNDIITALPPERSMLYKGEKYVHKGDPIFIDKGGALKNGIDNKFLVKKLPETGTSLFSADEFSTYFSARPQDFLDHSPFFYAARLWNAYHRSI